MLAPNPAITQDYSGELVEYDDHLELVPTVVSPTKLRSRISNQNERNIADFCKLTQEGPEVSRAEMEAARPKKRKREEVDGDYLQYPQEGFEVEGPVCSVITTSQNTFCNQSLRFC